MEIEEIKRLLGIFSYEDHLYSFGFNFIAGVDEVGRGSLAGPIVAAAVILNRKHFFIEDLKDSKKLSSHKRDILFKKILKCCTGWAVSKIPPGSIDRISLGKANILVMKKAVKGLKIKPDIVLTDAINIDMRRFNIFSLPITSGDQLSASIAAASIIAKVIRDRIMIKYARLYPHYDFKNNKGYGTKKHLLMLKKYGPSKIHRLSFKNVLNS